MDAGTTPPSPDDVVTGGLLRPGDPLLGLPKAHLHLHFTGSMRIGTLRELAAEKGMRLPSALVDDWPPTLRATDERGWFRFQRLYDAARACVTTEADMRRIVREAAQDDASEGSRWLEIQVDPTSYAPHVGGITPALEIVLDEAARASEEEGVGVAVVVAASRTRHPFDARALARLAAQHAGEGPGTVVGFGLSNDERRGETVEFERAFAIARRAGLASVPHAGELLGPRHVDDALRALGPHRLGHGVRASEDPDLLAEVVRRGIALEVCPGSNVALGVYSALAQVPLRELLDAGATIALGADDPLLFGSRLADQYVAARDVHGLDSTALGNLAKASFAASRAPQEVVAAAEVDIDAWVAGR
ncbi:adenosine deaminase [Kytococcus sp. Marseille-QA3725]